MFDLSIFFWYTFFSVHLIFSITTLNGVFGTFVDDNFFLIISKLSMNIYQRNSHKFLWKLSAICRWSNLEYFDDMISSSGGGNSRQFSHFQDFFATMKIDRIMICGPLKTTSTIKHKSQTKQTLRHIFS